LEGERPEDFQGCGFELEELVGAEGGAGFLGEGSNSRPGEEVAYAVVVVEI
jgi:hypothetical protein